MWYAISLGAGLVIGLAFAIWALSERSKRAKAEREAQAAYETARAAETIAKNNVEVADRLQSDLIHERQALAQLRKAIDGAYTLLAQSKDPAVIKAWLDTELKDETV